MRRVRIKICGITRAADLQAAARAGVDAVGFNFAPESPRFIGSPQKARDLAAAAGLATPPLWAGVFVNSSVKDVCAAAERVGLKIVQLHGDETPGYVAELKHGLSSGVAVWKAFRVGCAEDLSALADFDCDGWLLDAKAAGGARGGTGRTFDWRILEKLDRRRPLILGGGLNPLNVAEAIRQVRPDWVDSASGVEVAPGIKDSGRIEAFVKASRDDYTTCSQD